jgi:hypothetical protein
MNLPFGFVPFLLLFFFDFIHLLPARFLDKPAPTLQPSPYLPYTYPVPTLELRTKWQPATRRRTKSPKPEARSPRHATGDQRPETKETKKKTQAQTQTATWPSAYPIPTLYLPYTYPRALQNSQPATLYLPYTYPRATLHLSAECLPCTYPVPTLYLPCTYPGACRRL